MVPLKTNAVILRALTRFHNRTREYYWTVLKNKVTEKHKCLQVQDLKLLIPYKSCTSAVLRRHPENTPEYTTAVLISGANPFEIKSSKQ